MAQKLFYRFRIRFPIQYVQKPLFLLFIIYLKNKRNFLMRNQNSLSTNMNFIQTNFFHLFVNFISNYFLQFLQRNWADRATVIWILNLEFQTRNRLPQILHIFEEILHSLNYLIKKIFIFKIQNIR